MKIEILFKNQIIDNKIKRLFNKALKVAVSELNLPNKDFELSVMLVDNQYMKKLNKKYRNHNTSTNVLSFPQGNYAQTNGFKGINMMGDIVICLDKIRQESNRNSRDFYDHLLHIFLHGFLHLVGYTHDYDDDAKIMESEEIKILSLLKVMNPYSVI